jgi:hypothetical protein
VIADGDELGRHAVGSRMLANSRSGTPALLGLHPENFARPRLGQLSQQVGRGVGVHFSTMSAARPESSDSTIWTWGRAFERFGGDFVEGLGTASRSA